MEVFGMLGFVFGMTGFVLAAAANAKIAKLEKELKVKREPWETD